MATPPVLSDEDAVEDSVEEQPPVREHKHTTANMRPERPWKRWLLICLTFLVIIAVVVVLSIFLNKLFDPDEEDDWQASSDGNGTGLIDDSTGQDDDSSLPARSSFLNLVCAEDKISTDARAECEEACAPATDCCDPYGTGNSTCFEREIAGCVTYSQCHALKGTNDPAYNDIDRVCAVAALEVNREECEFACSSLQCCFNNTDSCLGTNFQACLDYAPCQNLRRTPGIDDAYIETAPFSLEADCRDGEPICEIECRKAQCCSDTTSRCYRENFIACLSYAWCTGNSKETSITVAPLYSTVAKAPDNLENVCLASYVAENGPSECQEACTDAACCFVDGAEGCFGDDPLGCLEYRSCSIVQEPTTT